MQEMGLQVWQGQPNLMESAHVHSEIEFNLVVCGAVSYLFGGSRVEVRAGELAVFWASVPHQLLEVEPKTRQFWVTLPLATTLGFELPEPFVKALLRGQVIVGSDRHGGARDVLSFADWEADLGEVHNEGERRKIVLLGLEARLRRLALAMKFEGLDKPLAKSSVMLSHSEIGRVEAMAAFMAQNYGRDLSLESIARSAGIHPNYAATLFKREFGLSILEFLTRYRLAHAQRLLVSSDQNVAQIGELCGFGSASRFHAVFKQIFGVSPAAYRASMRR